MRLAFKIMTGVMVVVAVLLVIHSYLVVNREIDLFRNDMNLHAYLLGSVLASSVTDIWRTVGPERVASIIDDANKSESLVKVRWVWFDVPPTDPSAPRVDIGDKTPLRNGTELLFPEYTYHDSDYHITYFPVQVDSSRLSALELSQPLQPMRSYVKTTVVRKIALFLAFLLVGGVLIWRLGVHLVAHPVHTLVDQARAVGQGDLDVRNDMEGTNDELGDLAFGLNEMVKYLRLARSRVEKETSGRLEAIEQLNHAERLATVGKLASGLAHELGTPLNVVAGRAKMIAREEITGSDIVDSATVIQDQAERMTGILRQLLDFARSKSSEKRRETLVKPVKNVTHMLEPFAAQRKVKFDVQPMGDSPEVLIDVGQIQQVLSNLLVNAVHAMPDGGTITIRYGQNRQQPPSGFDCPEGEYAFLEVIDTGIGIPAENLSRIFTPFFSTKQVGEGTGLGLSIAHGIVKEHGGWLAVKSTEGEGSVFSIHLPMGGNQ